MLLMKILGFLWALLAAGFILLRGLMSVCDSPHGCGPSSSDHGTLYLVGLTIFIAGAIAGWQKRTALTLTLVFLPIAWTLVAYVLLYMQ